MAWVEERLRVLNQEQANIRNVTVIAHVDHGKTTLTDSLLQRAGLLSGDKAGDSRVLDTGKLEQERGITIASTSIALPLEVAADLSRDSGKAKEEGSEEGKAAEAVPLLVNLIDSPGHADFSSEVTAALRLTDGAVVVVDVCEGVLAQTEVVLRQAIQEGVRPCLFVNKVDRLVAELKLSPDAAAAKIMAVVESVNAVIATYCDADRVAYFTVDIADGSVGIGSGYYGWGFTVDTLARMYDAAGVYTAAAVRKKFARRSNPASTYRRVRKSLVELGLKPVFKLTQSCRNAFKDGRVSMDAVKKVWQQLAALHRPASKALLRADAELTEKKVTKAALRAFSPVADSLLAMIMYHLPTPAESQATRAAALYTGPSTDDAAAGIAACDPDGPLVVYVSKIVPLGAKAKTFAACGRVFSGTVRAGQHVLVRRGGDLPPAADSDERKADEAGPGTKAYKATVAKVVALLGAKHATMGPVPAGNIVGLVGVDQHLTKAGTVVDNVATYPVRTMNFQVAPVVRVALRPPKPHLGSTLLNAVRVYSKTDPGVHYHVDDETNELILAGAGELHLEVAISTLRDLTGFDVTATAPIVTYRETVLARGDEGVTMLAKSGNKLNRLFVRAQALDENLVKALESGVANIHDAAFGRSLVTEYGWDAAQTKRIWAWGGDEGGSHSTGGGLTNVLVDCTVGTQHLPAIRANVVSAFKAACSAGGIAAERLRGVRFDLMDALVHKDPAHRGPSQIGPAAARVFKAALLAATPAVVQPMFQVTCQVNESSYGPLSSELASRRGAIVGVVSHPGTPLLTITATMPVANSFGFAAAARAASSGRASTALHFDSWQPVPGSVWPPVATVTKKSKSKSTAAAAASSAGAGAGAGAGASRGAPTSASAGDAADLVAAIRARKGMPSGVPTAQSFANVL